MIDADGKVVRRATQSAKNQTGLAPASLAATRAPSKRVQDKDLDDAQEDDAFPEFTEPENSDGKNVLVATRRTTTDDEEEDSQDISDTKPKWWKRRVSFSSLTSVITGGSRWRVIASVCSIALVIGMAAAFSKYRNLGLQQEKLLATGLRTIHLTACRLRATEPALFLTPVRILGPATTIGSSA